MITCANVSFLQEDNVEELEISSNDTQMDIKAWFLKGRKF